MMNPNTKNIKVTLGVDDNFLYIRTFSREHCRKRFILFTKDISDAMNTDGTVYHKDLENFMSLYFNKETNSFFVTITWLDKYSNRKVEGFAESFEIPAWKIESAILYGKTEKYLYKPFEGKIPIRHRFAGKTIRKALENKATRRALSKAMRDKFDYRDGEVTLFNDGGCDFYFKASGWLPINGGLILHKRTRRTKIGEMPEVYYSVHT